ncbi:reverse transcriptase domain-containing protein [Tanacetum coccineum]
MIKRNINWTRSCLDVVAFACVILRFEARHLCLRVCLIVNAPSGRLLGAYDLGVATPRAVVQADDKTSGDARLVIRAKIMPPRMTTRSAGRAIATLRGGRTGGRTSRGGGRTRGRSGDQGDGRIDGQSGQVGGQGTEVNDGVDGVLDFSTIIAQQLQNLLPTIVAKVCDQGRGQGIGRNPNGDAMNDNIQGDVRNVIKNNDHRGCTYKEFLACNPKEDNQKVKYTAGSFVGKALTWWNFQIHTRSREAVVGMSWEDFKTLTREEFCLSNEMQKLETELWNHAMVRAGHAAYTDRFHKLSRLVPHLVTPENKRIEWYIYGLAP